MRLIDKLLNRFTMYQVASYLLSSLVVLSFIFVAFQVLPYNLVLSLQNSAVIFITACILNYLFTKILNAYSSIQSTVITALILILISPIQFELPFWVFILIPTLAISSKYLLSYKKRHIFNPAAFAVVFLGLILPEYSATWWVGTPILFIPVLAAGFLILLKTNKFIMASMFLGVYVVSSVIKSPSVDFLWQNISGSALIFFASVMLTEPLTSPSGKTFQGFYAILVGLFYSLPLFNLIPAAITPEMSLLIGNIFSYIVNPKYHLDLALKRKVKLSSDLYELEFEKPKNFNFIPGQYLSWTLPHKKEDGRGNRRYFSIASSPTEDKILLCFREYEPSSSFKKALLELPLGGKIIASSLSGDFILPARLAGENVTSRPKSTIKPLVFIAGGIGITPFRSMVKYLIDKKIESNITLLYVVKKKEDLMFDDVFKKASEIGVKTIPFIGKYELEEKDFKDNIPDYIDRVFYISGPQPMVQNFKKTLKKLGVKKIEVDFFPGYN